jgi:hypothetical protein
LTLEQFVAVTRTRIPTAPEFLAFVEAQGWRIEARDDGTASLKADASDELALPLARMLGREPYRTGVLDLVRARRHGDGTLASPLREELPSYVEGRSVIYRSAPPDSRPREWLWRDGHTYAETPDNEWLFGRAERHPVGAWWWRHGGGEWKVVEGRVPLCDPPPVLEVKS